MQVINLGALGGGLSSGGGARVPETLGAKLLAHDIARQPRVYHELLCAGSAPSRRENLPVTIVSKTRLPERDYH